MESYTHRRQFETFDRQTSGEAGAKRRRCIVVTSVIVTTFLVCVAIIIATVIVAMNKMKKEEAQKESTKVEDETTGCGPFNVTYSESAPSFISSRTSSFYTTGCKISGNCWTRKQCYDCLEGPNRDKVGNLNHIPVCCPQCGRYGLSLSWTSCNCNNHGL